VPCPAIKGSTTIHPTLKAASNMLQITLAQSANIVFNHLFQTIVLLQASASTHPIPPGMTAVFNSIPIIAHVYPAQKD
jgi:hypothetical protein